MTRQSAKRRLAVDRHQLLILVLGAVMVGSFGLLVLWPEQEELSAIGSAVERERELLQQKVRASRTGLVVAARIPGMRRAQQAVERRLPPQPRFAEFLEAVAEQVEAEPLVRHEVERAESLPPGPVPAVPTRLRLAGPFASVYRCIAAIERLDRLCRFQRMHLARTADGEVTAEAEVLVYYLPVPPSPAGAPADRAAVEGNPQ